jgi:GT2 family glycosyltransferase
MATGDFIAFLDHDDMLHPDAIQELINAVARRPDLDLVYTDEDKITLEGVREDPYFKPDWSPDLLLSNMYVGHFLVIRRSLIAELGGLRAEFDGSQDFDLVLRATERTMRIDHIPAVLYHWRRVPGSTADHYENKPAAHNAARRALEDAVQRRQLGAVVEQGLDPRSFRVRYVIRGEPRVSVIIPTRDRVGLLRKCVNSLRWTVNTPHVELVVVNNASIEEQTYRYLDQLKSEPMTRVVDYMAPFNYSAIMNFAMRETEGEILLLLNNDVEALEPGWFEAMLEHALQPGVGAVGCKLVYPGERVIQHAGVIFVGGVAGHAHKGAADDRAGWMYGPDRIANYSAVTAACMMVPRDVLSRVGGFDESLAVAFNDVDLCIRIGEAGYRIVYTPFARLVHQESASVGRPEDGRILDAHEIEHMRRRWGSILDNDPHYNCNLPKHVENFIPWVHQNYLNGTLGAAAIDGRPRANNPVWMLPRIAMTVLRTEGPVALAKETARYIRERR